MCLFKNIILYLVAVPMVSIAWVTAVQMRKCENKLEMCVWKLIIHLLMWLFMQEQHCTHKKHCGPRLWYSLFISLRHSVHVQFQLNLVLPKPDQPYCLLRLRPWCCLLITWMFNFRVSWQGGDGLVDAHELWGLLSLHPQCVLLVRRLIIYKVHKQGKIQCLKFYVSQQHY